MGVRILHDAEDRQATIYCSTAMWSLGPMFYEHDDGTPASEMAMKFLKWLGHDPRSPQYVDACKLERKVNEFKAQYDDERRKT